jgi:hypothetical protein
MGNMSTVVPAEAGRAQSRFGVPRLRGSGWFFPPGGGTPSEDSGGVTRTHVYTCDNSGNMVHDENYAYGYDPENRLVKVRQSGPHGTLDCETIAKYVYDGDHCIAEYNGFGQLLQTCICGPGIDEPICMIEAGENNAPYYYHFDGLGSVIALTNEKKMVGLEY